MSKRRDDEAYDTVAGIRAEFVDPPDASRPMVRWWWFGPDVERTELIRQLEAMRQVGLGGVEIAVVYPMSGAPDQYLSDSFLADLRFAADEAARLGLRFDLTLGSGWPYGGPHVTPDLAARRLHWDRQEIGTAATQIPVPRTWPGDELVAAYVGDGSAKESAAWDQLPVADGMIGVPEGRGPRAVLTAVSRLTGQQVKRAAAGAEGAAIDHYSAAATARHIEAVCEPLLEAVPARLLGSVFCDSLEVFGADWTPNALTEFRARRGYDARPLLWLLHVDGPDARRFRADYYRTLTELCEENFIDPMRRWAAAHGVPFRIQAYGEPPVVVSSYRFADVFEGESWGWKDTPPTRWASSAAQLYGKSVVSSEVWTFVHSPSLRATPLDLKGEAHEHLLCGVNHLIGHGWPYSPRHADGVGWVFYAAGALDDRNPWWPAAASLNRYLQRLCWLLRRGERISDVGIYAPFRDVYGTIDHRGRSLNLWHGTRDHIGFDITRAVREAGFDFDLFDDEAIAVVPPARFPIVVLPRTDDLPESARAWLAEAERAGVRVLAVDTNPGIGTTVSPAELAGALEAGATTADVRISPVSPAIGTVHRRVDGVDIYLVVNTGPETERFQLRTRTDRDWMERWSATTAERGDRWVGTQPVALTLEAYEATVLVAYDGGSSDAGPEARAETASIVLADGWTVRFGDDEPPTPIRLPHRWEDDVKRRHFSGSATYAVSFELDHVPAVARLDLGTAAPVIGDQPGEPGMTRHARGQAYRADVVPPVGEIAEIMVNGTPAGVLWSPPYRIRVERFLRAGTNTIEITVSNTAANALAADAGIDARVDEVERRYGNRFRLQHLDRAMEEVNSGLLAVPRLRVTVP